MSKRQRGVGGDAPQIEVAEVCVNAFVRTRSSTINSVGSNAPPARGCSSIFTAGAVSCGEGEARCYVLADTEHIALFLPKALTREHNCPLLIDCVGLTSSVACGRGPRVH